MFGRKVKQYMSGIDRGFHSMATPRTGLSNIKRISKINDWVFKVKVGAANALHMKELRKIVKG